MNVKSILSVLGRLIRACVSVALCLAAIFAFLVLYPDSPLPEKWNPNKPLVVAEPIGLLTQWKLHRALSDPQQCLSALETAARFAAKPDFTESDQCHIRTQVTLSSIGDVSISDVNTRCQTALRVAMWVQHGIQPAAQARLQTGVNRVHHLSSYNCRRIRTTSGKGIRMSTHASAEAIDITGFTLTSGRKITLIKDWTSSDPATSAFLRDVRDSACTWFRVTLGPDYNKLHADHFHLQHTGWGLCR